MCRNEDEGTKAIMDPSPLTSTQMLTLLCQSFSACLTLGCLQFQNIGCLPSGSLISNRNSLPHRSHATTKQKAPGSFNMAGGHFLGMVDKASSSSSTEHMKGTRLFAVMGAVCRDTSDSFS